MLDWYQWQAQHHGVSDVDYVPSGQQFIIGNFYEETAPFRQMIESNDYTEEANRPCMGDLYVMSIAKNYRDQGISLRQLRTWFDDPRYQLLMKTAGTQSRIVYDDDLRKNFIESVGDRLGIDWSTVKDFFLNVQNPGEMFPWHRDRMRSQDYADGGEDQIKRVLIMLYDQRPGQVFFMGGHHITWRAGDVIGWQHDDFTPHGSANFGFWPRYSIRITGQIIKK